MIVATFNIHHAEGVDGKVDLERVADLIARTEGEIIALQELDRGHPRSGRVDQPRALAELTGLHVDFFPTLNKDRFEYGIGIASRVPLQSSFVDLPRRGSEEPRGAIVAEMNGITVIATHLATERQPRTLHMRALADLVRDARPPVLLLGDLNARARGTRPLREAGLAGGPRVSSTMVRRKKRIDWILATPPLGVVSAHTLPSQASDHLPLIAAVEGPSPLH
jgi:endonuclease/exonuclease/phosphatase family metal-dependent hydrolase